MGALTPGRIYAIDCVEGFSRLGSPASVVVTSPPYNIGKDYPGYDDGRPREEYLDWMEEVAGAAKGAMEDRGSFFLNVGGKPTDPWIPLDVAARFRRHFVLQNTIVWVKSIAVQKADVGDYPNLRGDIAVGHYQPVNSERYLNQCFEYIFHFTKAGDVPLDRLAVGVPYQDKTNVRRWGSGDGDRRDRGNTWFIPYETVQESRPHPTVFPVRLPEMCIRLHGVREARLVVDPFMGIGTTAVACLRLGVPFVGFELDPGYVRIAEDRIAGERSTGPAAEGRSGAAPPP